MKSLFTLVSVLALSIPALATNDYFRVENVRSVSISKNRDIALPTSTITITGQRIQIRDTSGNWVNSPDATINMNLDLSHSLDKACYDTLLAARGKQVTFEFSDTGNLFDCGVTAPPTTITLPPHITSS